MSTKRFRDRALEVAEEPRKLMDGSVSWRLTRRVVRIVRDSGASLGIGRHTGTPDPLLARHSDADTTDDARHLLDLRNRAEALSRELLAENGPRYAPDEENIFRLELAFSERHHAPSPEGESYLG